MVRQTFYWHDYETFGLEEENNLPAQFAGCRTDWDLNPIGEGEMMYCRPRADLLPSPEACLLTQILPEYCEEHGLSEARFAHAVLSRLAAPGTIGVGYNTMGFDDEVTRFLLWRNCLPPYEREYKNGCGRWDLYPFVLAVWALRPEGIVWPKRSEWLPKLEAKRILPSRKKQTEDGIVFKLECLTEANGISHENAHDAFADVYGTIGLAKLLKEKKPQLWNWALAHRSKQQVAAELAKGPAVWIDKRAGQEQGFTRCVIQIGADPAQPNRVFLWDLTHDPEELFTLKPDELRRRCLSKQEDLEEGETKLPIRSVRINQSPFICGDLRVLDADRAEAFGIDKAAVMRNAAKFTGRSSPAVAAQISAALADRKEPSVPGDPDTALYRAGFPSWADKELLAAVSAMDGETLAERVSSGKINFESAVYDELLFRYRARNFPETLNDGEKARWRESMRKRMAPALPEYREKLKEVAAEAGPAGNAAIEELSRWAARLERAISG